MALLQGSRPPAQDGAFAVTGIAGNAGARSDTAEEAPLPKLLPEGSRRRSMTEEGGAGYCLSAPDALATCVAM